MAAQSYYTSISHRQDHQHLLSPTLSSPGFSSGQPSPVFSSGQPSPLKPMHHVQYNQSEQYQHTPGFNDFEHLKQAQQDDAHLKARIRRFRVLSRVIAFLISIAVLIPLTMTLVKFYRTKNTYRTVTSANGQTISRTAWAHDSKTWPTLMYFGVAAISVLLNFGTVFSYKFGIETANTASLVSSLFSWVVMLGNLVVWTVAAGMYRAEKDKGGKSNDLWGWTCSAGARAIQKEFAGEVDFNQYCTVQGASFYIGIVQVGQALLTVFIYIMVFQRNKAKKNLQMQMRLSGFEQTRR